MKRLICVAMIAALFGLTACAKRQTPAADEAGAAARPQEETTPISTEDFESGEADGIMESSDVEDEGDDTETPSE